MAVEAALLITDLVDSTRLTEDLGDEAMSAVWAAHDRIARDLLATWDGTEINRSDGFLLRFDTVAAAAHYALAYHAALRAMSPPLRARAGLHLGGVVVRENAASDLARGAKASELAGLAVSATGRLAALAEDGQTLMTAEAKAALGRSSLRIVSHGFWRIKGIDEPLELFEVGDDEAPFTLPHDSAKSYAVVAQGRQWLPRSEIPHSLPGERNPFVGRRGALSELDERLDGDHRLLTVVGVGGTGKTRFVQHFVWNHLGYFPGGAWFCDLSQATSFDGLCGAVAHGLQVPLGNGDAVEQIGAAIAARGRCVVILDNFEQVAAHAASTVGIWLDRTVEAQFVVTSRNVLGLDGEEVQALYPLELKDASALFEMRARAAHSGFRMAEGDGERLSALIDLLDGLPLAIELAAARTRLLSVAGLLARMRERFSLLASAHGRPSRQTTLKATLDWSWDLLDEPARRMLAELSVFEGGFTADAMNAVVVTNGGPEDRLDILQSLIDQSWVNRTGEVRFGLLRSIQDYAAIRLRDAIAKLPDDALASTEHRHWRFFGSLDETAATAAQCADLDNLISAARRATEAGAGTDAALCLLSSWWALRRRGPFRVAVELGTAAAKAVTHPLDEARVQYVIGNAWRHMGILERARESLETALACARAGSAMQEECWILAAIGEHRANARNVADARTSYEEALALARRIGDRRSQCAITNSIGALLQETGRAEESLTAYETALRLAKDIADSHLEGGVVGNLGGALYSLGRLAEARNHFERAIALSQASANRRWEGNMRCNLGLCLIEQGDPEAAIGELKLALATAREIGHLRLECTAGWNLALAFRAADHSAAAVDQFLAARNVAVQLGDRRSEAAIMLELAPLVAQARGLSSSVPLFDEAHSLLTKLSDQQGLAVLTKALAAAESRSQATDLR